MGKYQEITKNIPWNSLGKETVASKLGKSIVPVGILPFQPQPIEHGEMPAISMREPGAEQYLMNIAGTAIQAGDGKLVTCVHVVESLINQNATGYILSKIVREGTVIYVPYPIVKAIRYVDPRTDTVNHDVDLSVLLVPAKNTEDIPYEIPNIVWGDSSKLGVGDKVVICGYPHGTEMFKFTKSNRGIIQPTFYQGIVSAIMPATKPYETRIVQVSIPSAG
ncbi:MAG: trypsin-like peptidase domain-containing protein, partial [Candidatus Subteraquimicrobiales bacterium]|nr:trypsin-like peptidase domain-containing protein [Candidatus Subteraquimicrobiales bacterium]